jgi:quercetin dioxygenase-like cupin family protein
MSESRILRAAKTDFVQEDWGSLRWVANAALGNAEGVTVGRVVIEKGKANPRHSHSNGEEVLYLLRGRLNHTFEADHAVLEPGDTISIPAGVAHNALSVGDEDAEMIVVYSSASREIEHEK